MPTISSAAPTLARRMRGLRSSLVRDILAAAQRPDMISFAGGLPAADLMPQLNQAVLQQHTLYQYGPSEGEPDFRAAVAQWISRTGLSVSPEQVLALSGSQQGLDLCAKLLIDEGTPLLTEAPTYLAALQVFELFGAQLLDLPLREDGPDLAAFEATLKAQHPRCAYLVPSFQNPSSVCYSEQARQDVAHLLDEYGVTLIEDDPYRDLNLDITHGMRPICSYLARSQWVYLGSFSKILWPGLRIGYLAASPALLPHLVKLKQASDLHTQRPGQMAVTEWLRRDTREADLQRLVSGYRSRRDAMQAALEHHLGDIADWRAPHGGLFFWLRLRVGSATRATLDQTMQQGLAFMPGEAFYAGNKIPHNTLRLNYSHATPEEMERGLTILSRCLRST